MPTYTIKEAANFFGRDGKVAEQLRVAARKGLISAANRAKAQLVTREIPQAVPPPIDKRIYAAGWQTEALPKGAAIYNATPYAAAIEEGVPAGNVVLSTKMHVAIAEWVQRKLGGGRAKSTPMRASGAPMRPRVNKSGVARDPAAARLAATNPQAWATAAAIMQVLKRRGIFNRGKGLRIFERFLERSLPAIIREEVEREIAKVGR